VYTNIQPVVKPVSTGLTTMLNEQSVRSTRLSNRVCQTSCTTRFDNQLNEQCCSFNAVVKPVWQPVLRAGLTTGWMFVYMIQPVVTPVWQPVVSC